MTRHNMPISQILGNPIGLDYSWFVIFGLLTWMLAGRYYPAEFKNWPPLLYWFIGAMTAVMLFVSVLLHELGHSVTALRYKIPVRSITLFLFGGIAQYHSRVFYCRSQPVRESVTGVLFLGAATGDRHGTTPGSGKILGILSREDIISFLRTIRELGTRRAGVSPPLTKWGRDK
ncbi:hypothetical protein JW979_14500 [bacterium]|nr:hypothetical protein [candidate division CSSED10-310 bacterium]